ncbi:MAG: hypothetical protein IJV67_00510 [Clostridia bacterium]|nr:hypothetical protein [Clostridia bacterium]
MGNYFFGSVKCLKDDLEMQAKRNSVLLVVQFCALAIGIILGIIFKPTSFIYDYYSVNAENYYCIAMGQDSSAFSVLLNRVFVNLGYFIICFVLSLSVWLYPCAVLITVYRGFVLSLTLTVFSLHFGISGVLIGVFIVLPQNVITTIALMLFSTVSCFKLKKGKLDINALKKNGKYVAVFYVISFVGALIEFLVLFLLLRPMSFYF